MKTIEMDCVLHPDFKNQYHTALDHATEHNSLIQTEENLQPRIATTAVHFSDTNQAFQSQKIATSMKFQLHHTICGAELKALISCVVTAQLTCVFVFAYADCWFSNASVHLLYCRNFVISIYSLTLI